MGVSGHCLESAGEGMGLHAQREPSVIDTHTVQMPNSAGWGGGVGGSQLAF